MLTMRPNSFVQEFIGDPLDGVTLLLDLLRAIQLSQANNFHNTPGSSATAGKIPPSIQRRALLDELTCLQCLYCCCLRYTEAIRKLTASSAGLFTLAVCIMSNVNKSRIIALQLLTKACEPPGNGHSAVSEALSTLRLRFGEPVRFRFLVGMLSSACGQGELLATGMKFINSFLHSAESTQKRLYVQAELEQAGFDINIIKKNVTPNANSTELIFEELDRWENNHIDVESLMMRVKEAEKENDSFRDKVLLLERRIQILQEEKGILVSLEQCLKERCSELQGEVMSLKSGKSRKPSIFSSQKRGGSTPAEDEGISSSERSLTPENIQRESSVYEVYSVQSQTISVNTETKKSKENITTHPVKITNNKLLIDDGDEEATIEEVMEELNNIINNAETEAFKKDREDYVKWKKREKQRALIEEAQVKSKIQMRVNSNVSINGSMYDESEIIPSNLQPQPPRKTRSLVHLYIPSEDYDYNHKEMFFENETMFTSEEGSDSLLSASKCIPKAVDKLKNNSTPPKKDNFEEPLKNAAKDLQRKPEERSRTKHPYSDLASHKIKSKSLDRIDNGLSTMVDIVMTDQKLEEENLTRIRPQSDSGNALKTLKRTSSNALLLQQNNRVLINKPEEKHRIFLPVNGSEGNDSYYFPRLQEKRTINNFQIKRGHANAGLYSGQITIGDNIGHLSKKIEYVSTSGSRNSAGKVTDLPSGLY